MRPRQEALRASIAADALPVCALFASAFTPATFAHAQSLAVAAILTTGRRTVSNLLRTLGHLAAAAPPSYHRVLSEAHGSGLRRAALLTRSLLRCYRPVGSVTLVGDDTVSAHPGRKVYGKARHRDAVRSSHRYTAWRWGHKRVVLAVLVWCPFASRPWTLPVLNVAWYGGGRRDVEVVSGCGHWYQGGAGLVEVRWVYVHDQTGTHRDEYFYTTDMRLTPPQVIEAYVARWNIETTFAEMRSYLGLETTRGWCARTVRRAEPCLFGLYSVVASLDEQLPTESQAEVGVEGEGKAVVTFSDAITAVRRWLWTNWAFEKDGHDAPFTKLPEPLRRTLLYALAPAA